MKRKIGLIPGTLTILAAAAAIVIVFLVALGPEPPDHAGEVVIAPPATPTPSNIRVVDAPRKRMPRHDKQWEVLKAAMVGDEARVRRLTRHYDIGQGDEDGTDILCRALYECEEPMVLKVLELLLRYGANADKALLRAISRRSDSKVVELLLRYGADPNRKMSSFDQDGETRESILSVALGGGHEGPYDEGTVRSLLRYGADPSEYGSVALAMAAIGGYREGADNVHKRLRIMKLLLKAGARVNGRDSLGRTPLMKIVRPNMLDDNRFVRFLLDRGAHVNTRDKRGRTALMWAMSDKRNDPVQKSTVELLLQRGATVNVRDDYGASPLLLATIHEEDMKIIRLLVANGADVNARDRDGWSPLHYLIYNPRSHGMPHRSITDASPFRRLISHGADVNARTKSGLTPLMLARDYTSLPANVKQELVQLLKNSGAK